MKHFRGRFLVSSVLVGLMFLLGSFQNCALHQSDGRKQLNSLLSRQGSSAVPVNCLPYLAKYDADIIFDDDTKTVIDDSLGIPTCKVSGTDERSGAGIAICTLVQDPKFQVLPATIASSTGWTIYNNKVYYYKSMTEYVDKLISDSVPLPPTGHERYYAVAVESGDFITYHFLGATVDMGIECRFSVDKVQFDTDPTFRQELAKRGSGLIQKLRQVCIDNGNCNF